MYDLDGLIFFLIHDTINAILPYNFLLNKINFLFCIYFFAKYCKVDFYWTFHTFTKPPKPI